MSVSRAELSRLSTYNRFLERCIKQNESKKADTEIIDALKEQLSSSQSLFEVKREYFLQELRA